MNKYNFIPLLIAFTLAILVSGLFKSNSAEREIKRIKERQRIELVKQITQHEKSVEEFKKIIINQELELVSANEELEKLQFNLKVSRAATAKARNEARRLSAKEKEDWLVIRYDSLSKIKSDSTITISEPVAGGVIDDLILKDGLVKEVGIKDSTITTYQLKDSVYQEIITTHEQKDVDQDSIISKQNQINKSLVEENNNLEKDVRRERRKVLAVKALAVIEGVLIILLIL